MHESEVQKMSLDEQLGFGGCRFVVGKQKKVGPKIDNNKICGYGIRQSILEAIEI